MPLPTKLHEIRRFARDIWERENKLVLFPEILEELISEQSSEDFSRNTEIGDQYSYIVNMFLIRDYLKFNEIRQSSEQHGQRSLISIVRIWGDFLNMKGLNGFFNFNLQSSGFTEDGIAKANQYVNQIIKIVYSETRALVAAGLTVKLFREGGDEVGGVIIIYGNINWSLIDRVVNNINLRSEWLTSYLGLDKLEYAKDPKNKKRFGCGFTMLARKVLDPTNSITQLTLEDLVNKNKKNLGLERIKRGLTPMSLSQVSLDDRHTTFRRLSEVDNQSESMPYSPISISQASLSQPSDGANSSENLDRLSIECYYGDFIQARYTEALLSVNVGNHLIAIKFTKLREINDAYSHICADYSMLKFLQLICDEREKYIAEINGAGAIFASGNTFADGNKKIEIFQLRMLGMIVCSSVGIIMSGLSQRDIALFIDRIFKRIMCEFTAFSGANALGVGENSSDLFVVTEQVITENVKEFLHNIYTILQQKEREQPVSRKAVKHPIEFQYDSGLEDKVEPVWAHAKSIEFSVAAREYISQVWPYMLCNLFAAASNYGVNALYAQKEQNENALSALNISYAIQASLINPTLGIASSAGKIMGEAVTSSRSFLPVGWIFRNAIVMNLPIAAFAMSGSYFSSYVLPHIGISEPIAQLVRTYFLGYIGSIPAQLVMRVQLQAALAVKHRIGVAQMLLQSAMSLGFSALCLDIFDLGVESIGIGMTGSSWLIIAATSLYFSCHKELKECKIFAFNLRNARKVMAEIFSLGVPYAGQMFIEQVGALGASLLAARMGTAEAAALQIANRYTFPCTIVGFAAANNLTTLIGRANGQDNFIQAKHFGVTAQLWVNGLFILPEIAFCLFPRQLAMPFIDVDDAENADILEILPTLMKFMAVNVALDNTRNVFEGALRGTGNSTVGLYSNILSLAIFLGLGYVLAEPCEMGVSGLFLARILGLLIVDMILGYTWNNRADHAINRGGYPESVVASTCSLFRRSALSDRQQAELVNQDQEDDEATPLLSIQVSSS